VRNVLTRNTTPEPRRQMVSLVQINPIPSVGSNAAPVPDLERTDPDPHHARVRGFDIERLTSALASYALASSCY